MEYERALFRVYDKSMEGLQSASARTTCWYIQKSFLVLSAALFATLVLLHHRFVNEPGCIASLIEHAAEREGLVLPLKGEWVAAGGLNSTADGEAGALGDGETNVGDGEDKEHEEPSGDESDNEGRVILLHSGVAIPNDVMIGIAIGEGGGGGSQNRRVWGLRGSHAGGRVVDGDRRLVEKMGGETKSTPPRPGRRRRAEASSAEKEDEELEGAKFATNSSARDASSSESDPAVDFPVDYIFSFEPRILLLPEKIRKEHGFRWLNFTLEPEECLSKAGAPARLLASRVVGYDVIMVNMFMMSSWSKGMLRNTETLAQWHWSKRAISPAGWLSRAGDWVKFKLEVVLSSLLAFVLISTVTAMTVRTLLSSGVVIMFPLVMLMERMGMTIVGVHQTLALSYPWLGMPIEHLRTRNKPITPFIMGHIMQMLVLYSVYNASLLAWSLWLYGKPMTSNLQLWLYGMVMLWEYFALIFVRSRSSIVFFSRMAAICFLAFHVYFYHFQTGYFALAAGVCFTAMFAVKLYVLQYLELPAFMNGDISHDEPRAHYVELPWSTWDAALPPMWSLFIPPNASTVGVYGDAVPDRPAAPAPQDEEVEVNAAATPSTRGGLRSRGRGRGRGRGASETAERRRIRGPMRGLSGPDGGDESGEGVEMTTRRRRATSSDVEEG